MTKNKLISIGLFTLLVAGTIIGFFFERELTPLEFQPQLGVSIISPPIALPDVTLTDQEGQPFKIDQLKGRWSLLFFGYTHCPDVCPTTLNNMNQVAKQLGNSELNYVFVTLDPKRDTPDKLKAHVNHFNPDFIGLSGTTANIDQLAETVGIIYDFDGDTSSDKYNVNHYAAILMVDPKGQLRAHILPPHPASKMVNVITKIREYYGE